MEESECWDPMLTDKLDEIEKPPDDLMPSDNILNSEESSLKITKRLKRPKPYRKKTDEVSFEVAFSPDATASNVPILQSFQPQESSQEAIASNVPILQSLQPQESSQEANVSNYPILQSLQPQEFSQEANVSNYPIDPVSETRQIPESSQKAKIPILRDMFEPSINNSLLKVNETKNISVPIQNNPPVSNASTSSEETINQSANQTETNPSSSQRQMEVDTEDALSRKRKQGNTLSTPENKKNKVMATPEPYYLSYASTGDENNKLEIYNRMRNMMRHFQRMRSYVELHLGKDTLMAEKQQVKVYNSYFDTPPESKDGKDYSKNSERLWLTMILGTKTGEVM